jgi:hypothetical protein
MRLYNENREELMGRTGRRQFLLTSGTTFGLSLIPPRLVSAVGAVADPAFAGSQQSQTAYGADRQHSARPLYNTNLQTAIGLGDESAGILDNFGQLKTRNCEVEFELGIPSQPLASLDWSQSLDGGYLPIVTTEKLALANSLRCIAFTSEFDGLKADYLGIEEANNPHRITLWFPYTTSIKVSGQTVTSGNKVLAIFDFAKVTKVSQAKYNYLTPEVELLESPAKLLPGCDPAFNGGWEAFLSRPIRYRFPAAAGVTYHVCLGLRGVERVRPGEMLLRLSVNGAKQVVDMGSVGYGTPILKEFAVSPQQDEIEVTSECDSSSTAPYGTSLLNGIWIFDTPVNLEDVKAGKLSEKARFYVQCGREPKQHIASSVVLEYEPKKKDGETRWIRLPYDLSEDGQTKDAAISAPAARTAAQNRWGALLDAGAEFSTGVKRLDDLYKTSLINIFLLRTRYPGEANGGQDLYVVKPGATIYDGFWYRDGAYIVAALDLAAHPQEAEKSLRLFWQTNLKGIFGAYGQQSCGVWQAPFTEWDGQGQALWALTNHFQVTGDHAWLRTVYESIRKGALWIKNVTGQTQILTDHGEKPRFFGLLPVGEGEAIGGGYQYYHDYWAVFGLRQAILAAEALGEDADAAWMKQAYDEFCANLLASVKEAYSQVGKNEVIPATPFDSQMDIWGSIAALYPSRFLDAHDPMLTSTLDRMARHCQEDEYTFTASSKTKKIWTYITADWAMCYLLRNDLPMFYRLFNGYVAHASPTNAWTEEIFLDSHLGDGDMPHGWAAAQYVHLHRNALLYEDGNKLELCWGVQPGWLRDGGKISVAQAPTRFGRVKFQIERLGSALNLDYHLAPQPNQQTPAEVRLHVPAVEGGVTSIRVNGNVRTISPGESVISLGS